MKKKSEDVLDTVADRGFNVLRIPFDNGALRRRDHGCGDARSGSAGCGVLFISARLTSPAACRGATAIKTIINMNNLGVACRACDTRDETGGIH